MDVGLLAFRFSTLRFGSKIFDFESSGFGFAFGDSGFWILNSRRWALDCGLWALGFDFGFWIQDLVFEIQIKTSSKTKDQSLGTLFF